MSNEITHTQTELMPSISLIIPCKNEELSISILIEELMKSQLVNEIIVVNDGSTDGTAKQLQKYDSIKVITHQYSKGNGAAIKAGARKAQSDYLLFMDSDGQHQVGDIPRLISEVKNGFDMVIGARDAIMHASKGRRWANSVYCKIASYITGHRIDDLTSGFRLCNRKKFLIFLNLLPNGFSYPTTITMAFYRSGFAVKYVPISVLQRQGSSHISLLRDGIKFFLIIFKMGTLYSPLKFFVPLSVMIFGSGIAHYIYTYILDQRFTNMSLLLLITSMFIFIFGLISEQITMQTYLNLKNDSDETES